MPHPCSQQWAFDSPTAAPRLLKSRTGHHSPLTSIRYYGQDGKQILTASRDRSLRYTSVVRDSRSYELSQGSVVKKATALGVPVKSLKWNPIVRMSSEVTRSKDWEDVVTMHEGDSYVRSWRLQEKKAGRWAMEIEDGSVSVSGEAALEHASSCNLTSPSSFPVCMYIGMWELCSGWIVDRSDPAMEFAIGSRTKVL
jgi:U3 small nucleolar RNA-associated protein 21